MKVGTAGIYLGVGRNKTSDAVCAEAGVIFYKKSGAFVEKGETIMEVYGKSTKSLEDAMPLLESSIRYSTQKPKARQMILKVIYTDADGSIVEEKI